MSRPLARLRSVLPPPALQAARSVRRGWWRAKGLVSPAPEGEPRPPVPDEPVRLFVGPVNFAGQGWAWGRAAHDRLTGVGSVVMAVQRPRLNFEADYDVLEAQYKHPSWGFEQRRWLGGFTHVLDEAVRPLTGRLSGDTCDRELPWLRDAGVQVALVAHGSDIRLPSLHRQLYPFSPFRPDDPVTRTLTEQSERCRRVFLAYDGPRFVSTPDLLDFAPGATWLPVVVDAAQWASDEVPLVRPRPVVLHVPSNPFLKGSRYIDAALTPLAEQGLIEYRRLEDVLPEDMPDLVRSADVVVDQVVLGLYSAMAIQAMHAGKVVLAHVSDRCRERLPYPLPIVEAPPDGVAGAVERVLDDRPAHQELAARGREYAQTVHDGRMSAAVLAPFLGVAPPAQPGPAQPDPA
jgi:hypothetical protein